MKRMMSYSEAERQFEAWLDQRRAAGLQVSFADPDARRMVKAAWMRRESIQIRAESGPLLNRPRAVKARQATVKTSVKERVT